VLGDIQLIFFWFIVRIPVRINAVHALIENWLLKKILKKLNCLFIKMHKNAQKVYVP
jgi:hypothetical protein